MTFSAETEARIASALTPEERQQIRDAVRNRRITKEAAVFEHFPVCFLCNRLILFSHPARVQIDMDRDRISLTHIDCPK